MQRAKILSRSSKEALPVKNRRLCQEWWYKDVIEYCPVPMILRPCNISGGGAEEYLSDWEADIFSGIGEGNVGIN